MPESLVFGGAELELSNMHFAGKARTFAEALEGYPKSIRQFLE